MNYFKSIITEYKSIAEYFYTNDLFERIEEKWNFSKTCEKDFSRLFKKSHISKHASVGKYATLIHPVIIGPNTKVLNGAYIEGPVAIGNDCSIGPNCYIRPTTIIANNVRVGQGVEIKASFVNENVSIAHTSYIGHTYIGKNTMIGVGLWISTRRLDDKSILIKINNHTIDTDLKKFGAFIGEDVKIGSGTLVMPGQIIPNGKRILPGTILGFDRD